VTQQDKKILCAWMRRAKKVNSEINEKAQELKALMGEEAQDEVQKNNSTVAA
jgi:hypothetical protein